MPINRRAQSNSRSTIWEKDSQQDQPAQIYIAKLAYERDTENEADDYEESSIPNSCSTSSPGPIYASILKRSCQHLSAAESRSSPTTGPHTSFSANSPSPKCRHNQVSLMSTPILTGEVLQNRFHNKPLPFKLAGVHQMFTNRNRLIAVATKTLSTFLLSALPTFSGLLSVITWDHVVICLIRIRFCSRWPTGTGRP